MAREDTPLDQAVFDSTMEAELAKGTDRRVAEGRARSAAVRAYKAAHPEEAGGSRRCAQAGRSSSRGSGGRAGGDGNGRSRRCNRCRGRRGARR